MAFGLEHGSICHVTWPATGKISFEGLNRMPADQLLPWFRRSRVSGQAPRFNLVQAGVYVSYDGFRPRSTVGEGGGILAAQSSHQSFR